MDKIKKLRMKRKILMLRLYLSAFLEKWDMKELT